MCKHCEKNKQMHTYAICVACKVQAEKQGGITIDGSWFPLEYLCFIKK